MREPYFMGYSEGEDWDRVSLSYSLSRATDLFMELAQLEATGTYLADADGMVYGTYSGYGDTLSVAPPAGTFEFYGPHPDYEGEDREARQWESERRYENAMRFQL